MEVFPYTQAEIEEMACNPFLTRVLAEGVEIFVTDEVLIARYYGGDDSAFEELYRRRYPCICRFFYRNLSKPGLDPEERHKDAEDLAHDTLMKVLMTKGKPTAYSPGRGAAFLTWAFTIARHTLFDFWRHGGREEPFAQWERFAMLESEDGREEKLPSVEEGITADSFTPPLPRPDEVVAVHEWLEKLSAEERLVVTLRMEGIAQTEIAQILGTSNAEVTRLKQSALAKLRPYLED